MKDRLSRLDEIYSDQLFYFLTFCTQGHSPVLAHPELHQSFDSFCQEARLRNILVGRYVIMPDHVHVFAAFAEPDQLSPWIKSLKNSLSKTLRALGYPAPHWQKGFFDHLMRNENSYGQKWDYVRENPVRKGLVAESSLWPWQGEVNLLPYR